MFKLRDRETMQTAYLLFTAEMEQQVILKDQKVVRKKTRSRGTVLSTG